MTSLAGNGKKPSCFGPSPGWPALHSLIPFSCSGGDSAKATDVQPTETPSNSRNTSHRGSGAVTTRSHHHDPGSQARSISRGRQRACLADASHCSGHARQPTDTARDSTPAGQLRPIRGFLLPEPLAIGITSPDTRAVECVVLADASKSTSGEHRPRRKTKWRGAIAASRCACSSSNPLWNMPSESHTGYLTDGHRDNNGQIRHQRPGEVAG